MSENAEWIEALVEQYERPLGRYAFSLAGSVSQAQDAVQETFLRLCQVKRSRIEGHEAAWLFRVCRSRVIDMKRKDKPVQPLTPLDTERIAAPEPSPADAVMQADTEALVPRLLRTIPERQAEAIRLKFQQSLSYREIAHVMRISESNVGFLIHVGIKALRARMHALQGA
ncbi:MAG: sigma-70 family RNA polymerase sigma factor [Kiritimatiellae bacterium]|nr:sigma-70 family RNA polymerase sigma factor [Kiritimatiellia bacterium]